MAALYYSKWKFIEGLLLALRAAHRAGEDARHTVGRGGPVDLDDLGPMKGISVGMKSVRRLVPQLTSYQDLMAEVCSPLLLFLYKNSYTRRRSSPRPPKCRHLIHACLTRHGRHAPPARLPVRNTAPSALRDLDVSRDVDNRV
jgi:hypothetical protein